MKFSEFLRESKEKHAVFAFGRMNPITAGHEKLVNKVQDIANKVGGSAHIVVSHSQDAKKNPLSAAQKLKHAKRAFPDVHVTASDKSAPNFLAQAAKLHKQGVTHLHMVGGQDRVDEYHRLLHQYNGVKGPHGSFNFKKIEVHSAGDRDPDAEGVEGMSASKMREHAKKGNFKEFRSGVPSAMSHAHAKEMYNDVRKGMGVNEDIDFEFEELLEEDIDNEFEQILTEGVHDKGIFKAVFLGGGPGSGKDYVLSNTLDGHGLTEINSDKALEFLMDKEGLDKTMPASEQEKRNEVRKKAKDVTELRQRLALHGRNGLIINGTADDVEKIAKIKQGLEELGYETQMIMVNTADEVSAQRNIERGQRGGRTVPENIRRSKWELAQNARPELAKLFGQGYMEFDNSEDLRNAPPEVVKAKKEELMNLYKNVQQFVATPPKNPAAEFWVAHEMEKKDTQPIPKGGAEMVPHHGSAAAEEARKLGLQYYGFGRYGQQGKVTHRVVHDKLVEVQKDQPEGNTKLPISGSSQKKTEEKPVPGRTMHKLGDKVIHVKMNEEILSEVVGEGGRKYESDVSKRLKKYGRARPDAKTAGSSADAPDATFLHKNKEHNLEVKADKGAMFGQMELHHNGTSWDASEKSKIKYPETYKEIKKSGFFKTLNSQWKKPSGNYEKDLKMGNVYHEHPNADPIKAHYGKDRNTNYIQIGGGHGFYHTGNDVAKLGSPELHGKTQIRARMKPRGYDSKGNRTYGALAVMSLKGDIAKSHHDIDVDPGKKRINESYSLSDSGAMNLLLLGNSVDEHDVYGLNEKDTSELLRDRNGKVRTFMLRSAASKEAHTKNGTVYPYKNGYVVKIHKEKKHVTETIELFEGETSGTKSYGFLSEDTSGTQRTSASSKTSLISEETCGQSKDEQSDSKKYKITIATIRQRQKEKVMESIDRGTEVGLSMASSGENLSRSTTKVKPVKKPLEELTGDETTMSTSDKKEDELKKVGINLKTFKAKKFVG